MTNEITTTENTVAVDTSKTNTSNYVDISSFQNIPDMDSLEVQDVNLSIDYWTPEEKGETRRAVFRNIEIRKVPNEETGEVEELPTGIFYTKIDGEVVTFANSSKRLVGIFENGNISSGFLCQITYMGKEKNATNQFRSDRWKVNPLKTK